MASRPGLVSRPSSVTTQSKTVVLVTGGNAGIGLEIVRSLAALPNHQILLGSRDIHRGEDAAAALGALANVNPIQLDISSDESINHAALAIGQHFGKLDILINNAGTTGIELDSGASLRDRGRLIYETNVIGTACVTEAMLPLLERAKLPKVIFVGSGAGSIAKLEKREEVPGNFMYGSSKSAVNYLAVHYARKFPKWKVNCVCPGYRATKINNAVLSEETDPKLGAVRVVELVKEGPDGVTGTYSNNEGPLGW